MSRVQALIASYVESAKKHGEATFNGDSTAANNACDKMIEIINLIHKLDPDGTLFLHLLKHENESVKLWSATHALFIDEVVAMETLQEIAKGAGISSFSASMVVEQWYKGALKSPI